MALISFRLFLIQFVHLHSLQESLQSLLQSGQFLKNAQQDDPVALKTMSAASFAHVIISKLGHQTPRHLRSNIASLPNVCNDRISRDDYTAFLKFQSHLSRVSPALIMASQRGRLSRVDFERALRASDAPRLPPHVVSLIFHVFNDPNALGMLDLPSFLAAAGKSGLELDFGRPDDSTGGIVPKVKSIFCRAYVQLKTHLFLSLSSFLERRSTCYCHS